ncbi:hypothetical protein Clacol_005937 [Clathrus columnatus]|uniref:Uncharacterized protein n=1 Tax=Clathrus columnatus TaxID=1419009 RepID=A0AAV5AAP3_9AGAM|nr:hypothetical protein Clacol_005937 [Clathrus columnatus]
MAFLRIESIAFPGQWLTETTGGPGAAFTLHTGVPAQARIAALVPPVDPPGIVMGNHMLGRAVDVVDTIQLLTTLVPGIQGVFR